MNHDPGSPRWRPWLGAAILAAIVGITAYSVGLHQAAPLAAGGVPVRWHGGFPFGGILLLWLAFLLFRGFFWSCGGGWRYRHRYDAWYDDPARWDEWHRRAHEHMTHADDTRR
jgi:hypothetical protein